MPRQQATSSSSSFDADLAKIRAEFEADLAKAKTQPSEPSASERYWEPIKRIPGEIASTMGTVVRSQYDPDAKADVVKGLFGIVKGMGNRAVKARDRLIDAGHAISGGNITEGLLTAADAGRNMMAASPLTEQLVGQSGDKMLKGDTAGAMGEWTAGMLPFVAPEVARGSMKLINKGLRGSGAKLAGFAAQAPSADTVPILERGRMPALRNNTAALAAENAAHPTVTTRMVPSETLVGVNGRPLDIPTVEVGPGPLTKQVAIHDTMMKRTGAGLTRGSGSSTLGTAVRIAQHPLVPSSVAQALYSLGGGDPATFAEALRAALLSRLGTEGK